ncbi:MAG: hypothetical protein GY778_29095 [bacterium]|nr:hypothetical protein [bacterium]
MTVTCAGLVAVLLFAAGGCDQDARLADHTIPHVEVTTVSDQGLELGNDADPQEVVYVLLKAIRDDVLAGDDAVARRAALDRQFAVCDPDYLYDWYRRSLGPRAVAGRDDVVYKRVRLWAPALAHYAGDLDFDLETARSRMTPARETNAKEGWPGETVQVDLPVADPQGGPKAGAVIRVRLHRHDQGVWRVFQVGFTGRRSTPAVTPKTPTPTTAPTEPDSE